MEEGLHLEVCLKRSPLVLKEVLQSTLRSKIRELPTHVSVTCTVQSIHTSRRLDEDLRNRAEGLDPVPGHRTKRQRLRRKLSPPFRAGDIVLRLSSPEASDQDLSQSQSLVPYLVFRIWTRPDTEQDYRVSVVLLPPGASPSDEDIQSRQFSRLPVNDVFSLPDRSSSVGHSRQLSLIHI